jgi:hypothetical protein
MKGETDFFRHKLSTQRKTTLLLAVSVFVVLIILTACAPRQAQPEQRGSNADGLGSEALASLVWSPEADCTTCHLEENSSLYDRTTAAGVHGENFAVTKSAFCMACHTDVATLATAHEDMKIDDMPKRLKRTEVVSGICTAEGCHDDSLARIQATVTQVILTDDNGTTVNPHDLPATESHIAIACSSCHIGHKPMAVKQECIGCHHMDVFECGTCHE